MELPDHDRIATLHRQGFSAPQIAVAVGCTSRTVYRWRKRNGLSLPSTSVAVTPDRLRLAGTLLAGGASNTDVARTMGMSRKTVRRYFPGQAWTKQEAGTYAVMVRRLNAITGLAA